MITRPIAAAAAVALLLAGGCGRGDDDGAADGASTTTSGPIATSAAPPTTSSVTTRPDPSTTVPATSSPPSTCPADEALAAVDGTIEQARLTAGGQWSADIDDNPFADRTASGDEFAARLALDCGVTATQSVNGDQRLVVAAWTGPRVAYVIQATDGPPTPYANDATVDVLVDAPAGEFVDGDERSVWAGTVDSGETFVVGHIDYVLGAPAKDWMAGPRPASSSEANLDSERHAIAALEQAGMRNVGIAELAELGSEEGFVQFISPTGQISAVDVAPTGWFDPMAPRFFTGPTRFETVGGVEVRVTAPAEGDNLGFTRGNEFGWACDEFGWILEPPFNGDADEMRTTVEAIVATEECRGG